MCSPPGNDLTIGNVAAGKEALHFPRTSRDKHLYVCGATGTGKSKFLEHLIRQDIASWYKSRCGMLLLDPHGSLYDAIIAWLARAGVSKAPIIPIDLREDDWVVSYNLLRKRGVAATSVVIDNFVQAMAHVWGEAGTDQTPRFARWAANILCALYENDLTLLEAEYLIDHLDRQARQVLGQKLEDKASRRDWRLANELKPREFEAELGSTANRLHRFLRNPRMRSIFGQGSVSLDLGKALDEGHIILVSLATAGAQVSEEDADLFGTLLLSDLWTASLERGKTKGVKPFYLYMDEFQRFVTPTIARSLDEARGFGLHVTMANQFPQQLVNEGKHGQRLYDSIMENASSKVVFRLQSEENLRPLAQWLFRGVMNPDEIKHALEATRVVDYREEERVSVTKGRSESHSVGESIAHGTGTAAAEGRSHSVHSGTSYQEDFLGIDLELDRTRQTSESDVHVRSLTHSESEVRGTSEASGESESHSQTTSKVLIPVLSKEVSQVQFRSLDEQLERAMFALYDQEQRYGVVRLAGMKRPVSFKTPNISEPQISKARLKAYVAKLLDRWEFALPTSKAIEALAVREKQMEIALRAPQTDSEPTSYRRKIDP